MMQRFMKPMTTREPGLSTEIRKEVEKIGQTKVTTKDKESLVLTTFKVCVDSGITVDINTRIYVNPAQWDSQWTD